MPHSLPPSPLLLRIPAPNTTKPHSQPSIITCGFLAEHQVLPRRIREMKIRKIVSLVAFLSFCVMALTGIVMFLAPQSRVAYWSGWELFGFSKRDYDEIHSTFMLLFLTSIVWHTVLNWRSLVEYLRTGARTLVVFTTMAKVPLSGLVKLFGHKVMKWIEHRVFSVPKRLQKRVYAVHSNPEVRK